MPLDFDASHDEDNVSAVTGSRPPGSDHQAQRAPNQSDAPGAEVMADNREAESGFDDEGQPTARDMDLLVASDNALSEEDDTETPFYAGKGDDDPRAVEPVSLSERKALERKIAIHAKDPNAFEPAEAEVQRAIQRQLQAAKS